MNCVRKHLSAIKGGRLAAAAAPAQVVSLLISDVPGDDPAVIASGPTVPDPTDFAEARAVLEKYAIDLPQAVGKHMAAERKSGVEGQSGVVRVDHGGRRYIKNKIDNHRLNHYIRYIINH